MTRRRRRSVCGTDTAQEVFNDLLFNTLGVLLLLLLISMALVGVPDVSAERYEAVVSEKSRVEGELAVTQGHLEIITNQRDDARAEASALRPRPIDAIVVCDGTVSMSPVLAELCTALKSAAEVGSRLSPRFRLGVVVYRDAGSTDTFPLTEIGRKVDGRESAGMTALRNFVDLRDVRIPVHAFQPGSERGTPTGEFVVLSRMGARSGFAEVEGGLRAGVLGLRNTPAGTRRTLIIIGDVGPWEKGNPDTIENADRQSAERCTVLIKSITDGGTDVRVLSLFTGRNLPGLAHREESASFFRDLAAAGKGVYSEDPSHIAATIIEAVLAPDAGGAP